MEYETTWLGWKAGKISDGEIIARMHVDPFFKRWFEHRRQAMWDQRGRSHGGQPERKVG